MSEIKLVELKCVPCMGNEPTVPAEEMKVYLNQLPGWHVIEQDGINRLQKVYMFKNFRQALDFTNRVGEIAEQEDHHPALTTEWGRVTIIWWTHAINGLHRNDFVMAAKSDRLYETR